MTVWVSRTSDSAVCGLDCLRTLLTTALALTAFAANSILCRMALSNGAIDPASFSAIRLASGALALLLAAATRVPKAARPSGSWTSAAFLFLYAVAFSFAYLGLSAGTGALILFGAVQGTMITAGLISGERPRPLQWIGLLTAVAGLVVLVLPGLEAPPLWGAALMVLAGWAWGVYSLRGRDAKDPVAVTCDNFRRAVPMAVALAMLPKLRVSPEGALLAVVSGALTSGMGYVVWYAALQHLSATRAAAVQLLVPVLAAAGGVAFLSETITLRLVIASAMIIGGVGTAMMVQYRPDPATVRKGGGGR